MPPLATFGVFIVCAAVAVGAVWKAVEKSKQSPIHLSYKPGDVTGSISKVEQRGPSGLPLPRFVSLKSGKVNVRKGPSSDHDVAWVFQRKGMPVEITAEFENWRRIRDSDGAEGWILQQMLAGKRTGVIMGYGGMTSIVLRDGPAENAGVVASLQAGVSADVKNCTGTWCRITAGGYDGYVVQDRVWGVYPGEVVD
jgi:SH3-like domain-containing protein